MNQKCNDMKYTTFGRWKNTDCLPSLKKKKNNEICIFCSAAQCYFSDVGTAQSHALCAFRFSSFPFCSSNLTISYEILHRYCQTPPHLMLSAPQTQHLFPYSSFKYNISASSWFSRWQLPKRRLSPKVLFTSLISTAHRNAHKLSTVY